MNLSKEGNMTHKSNNQQSTLTPPASGLIEFMDISPIACRIGVRSQVVMTTRAWSFGYAPDPGQHSLPQQIAMRTTAPQLRDMIEAMFSALVGEDRTPCQFTFHTESPFLVTGPTRSIAVMVNRGGRLDDYLILDPCEQWFADYLIDSGLLPNADESWEATKTCRRFEQDLNRLLRMAEKSFH
jgi:hypothetical protein